MSTSLPYAGRDEDLDERPFGDSHFGGTSHRRKARTSAAERGSAKISPPRTNAESAVTPSDFYALHDGFFDETPPPRSRDRRQPARAPRRP